MNSTIDKNKEIANKKSLFFDYHIILYDEPYSFTISAVIIGLLLTSELSSEEQDSFGNWLQLVGLVLQTYGSQVTTLEIEKELKNIRENLSKEKKSP